MKCKLICKGWTKRHINACLFIAHVFIDKTGKAQWTSLHVLKLTVWSGNVMRCLSKIDNCEESAIKRDKHFRVYRPQAPSYWRIPPNREFSCFLENFTDFMRVVYHSFIECSPLKVLATPLAPTLQESSQKWRHTNVEWSWLNTISFVFFYFPFSSLALNWWRVEKLLAKSVGF